MHACMPDYTAASSRVFTEGAGRVDGAGATAWALADARRVGRMCEDRRVRVDAATLRAVAIMRRVPNIVIVNVAQVTHTDTQVSAMELLHTTGTLPKTITEKACELCVV